MRASCIRVSLTLLGLAIFGSTALTTNADSTHRTRINGKALVLTITDADIKGTGNWLGDKDDPLPITPDTVRRLADKGMVKTVRAIGMQNASAWNLQEIRLVRYTRFTDIRKWYYLAIYSEGSTGKTIYIGVLLNGKTVLPTFADGQEDAAVRGREFLAGGKLAAVRAAYIDGQLARAIRESAVDFFEKNQRWPESGKEIASVAAGTQNMRHVSEIDMSTVKIVPVKNGDCVITFTVPVELRATNRPSSYSVTATRP